MRRKARERVDVFFVGIIVGVFAILLLYAVLGLYMGDEQQVTEEDFHDEVSKITLDEFEEITECTRYEGTGHTVLEASDTCTTWLKYENGTWIDDELLVDNDMVFDGLIEYWLELPFHGSFENLRMTAIEKCLSERTDCVITDETAQMKIRDIRTECLKRPVQETECVEWKLVGYRMSGR